MWRRRRGTEPLDGFAELASTALAVWRILTEQERQRLVELGSELVTQARWEAAHGFELTDEMVVTIAGGAALLVLELGIEQYRHVHSIVVHPRAVTLPGIRSGPAGTVTDTPSTVIGQAEHGRGAILIAWRDARRSARHLHMSENVVLHEFAHKL
ncbi:MAG: zinc-dependent peptidase, partial [Acidimicrobiales bacterium]|nr:zinc-dependent peptidase [Acidimicrobiales bacterium]